MWAFLIGRAARDNKVNTAKDHGKVPMQTMESPLLAESSIVFIRHDSRADYKFGLRDQIYWAEESQISNFINILDFYQKKKTGTSLSSFHGTLCILCSLFNEALFYFFRIDQFSSNLEMLHNT